MHRNQMPILKHPLLHHNSQFFLSKSHIIFVYLKASSCVNCESRLIKIKHRLLMCQIYP